VIKRPVQGFGVRLDGLLTAQWHSLTEALRFARVGDIADATANEKNTTQMLAIVIVIPL